MINVTFFFRILVLITLLLCIPSTVGQRRATDPMEFKKNIIGGRNLGGARWELDVKSPLVVYFAVDILDISMISVTNGDFRLDLNMKQRWTEDTLEVPVGLFLDEEPNSTRITADNGILEELWTPDLYIPNARSTLIESLTFDQKSVVIFKNKTIVYYSNFHTVIGCPMEFQWYPMETHSCPLFLESYSYTDDLVSFAWETDMQTSAIRLPYNFSLRNYVLQLPLQPQSTTRHRFGRKETYSRLMVLFVFQRQLGHAIIQVFIPTFLIVALSSFSFWLGLDAIPARVSLLVTCMLTLVTLYSAQKSDLPPIAYVKMSDIWMAGCLCFVFAAMCELVLVRYLSRQKNSAEEKKQTKVEWQKKANPVNNVMTNEFTSPYLEFYVKKNKAMQIAPRDNLVLLDDFYPPQTQQRRAMSPLKGFATRRNHNTVFATDSMQSNSEPIEAELIRPKRLLWEKIDRASRAAFPLIYISFLIVYWVVLLFGGPGAKTIKPET